MRPVIDICGTAYDEDSWRANLTVFANKTPGYLHFFGETFAKLAGIDYVTYQSALASSPQQAVDALMAGGNLPVSAEQHVLELKRQGVRRQVLHGAASRLPSGETVNDRVAAMASAQPSYLEAWAGLDASDIPASMAELERCVREHGMTGGSIVHFSSGVDPLSSECHELYGLASDLCVPLWIHVGMNLATNRPLESSTWNHIDRIAVEHPRLAIIAGHGGWPRILDAMAILQRHPNVYLEFSAHRPKIMGKAGSGWEPLFLYGRTVCRHKILFGSAGFVQRQSIRELADEVAELGLEEQTTDAWLHDNAARLLNLDD